ncbi:major facilitator superfamily domain-containing protein [Mycena sp. CBHHK59/15]|nr:major facilitator superfamily domain-containing protein [Mycena sp. CBHHK59/15]
MGTVGPVKSPKSWAFWMSFATIMVATFLSALDLIALGTALPTIATALHDTEGDYIWVGSAYALSSTVFIPLSGSLADAFGRKPIMLVCITFFAVGSALAGASQNMVSRGIGGGGIINLSEILTADLVPLAERGLCQGMLGLVWSFASCIGPPIVPSWGGPLSSENNKAWRWLFCKSTLWPINSYLNLPLTSIAFLLVSMYLSVRTPEGSVDWVGNAIAVVGTGLTIIGMTWGGIRYSWASSMVLAPLLIGLALLFVFGFYEARIPSRPAIPLDIVGNRTSLSGQIFIFTFLNQTHCQLHRVLSTAAHAITSTFFFQACFGASLIRSAVDFLPVVNWVGWIFIIVTFGLFNTIKEDSGPGKWVTYQLIRAIGVGTIYSALVFPLLAPLPNNRAASALALFSFTRSSRRVFRISRPLQFLQNMLKKNLLAAFVAQFPVGVEIAYATIPAIKELEEPLRKEVQAAFAASMAVIWQTMTGVAGLGLLFSFLMAEIPMDTTVDENYALEERQDKIAEV